MICCKCDKSWRFSTAIIATFSTLTTFVLLLSPRDSLWTRTVGCRRCIALSTRYSVLGTQHSGLLVWQSWRQQSLCQNCHIFSALQRPFSLRQRLEPLAVNGKYVKKSIRVANFAMIFRNKTSNFTVKLKNMKNFVKFLPQSWFGNFTNYTVKGK